MKAFTYLSLFVAALLITACGDGTNAKNNTETVTQEFQSQLQSEVMAIHDEVMPKMSEINRISRALRTYLEENPDLEADQKESITKAVSSLDQSGEAMMDWMSTYGDLTKKFKDMNHDAVREALEKEKENITIVKDMMLSGIETGSKLLVEIQ